MQKFWDKVEKTETCWNWKASCGSGGYGQFNFGQGDVKTVHRISWMLHNGEIPAGLHVLHKCDNRKCVNPEHLFLGTNADNMRDMWSKGRAKPGYLPPLKGAAHPGAKLTDLDIKVIRALQEKHQDIADFFKISRSLVSVIRSGKRWKHVE